MVLEPGAPGRQAGLLIEELLDPERAAGFALQRAIRGGPDDAALLVGTSRLVEYGARTTLLRVPGLFRLDVTRDDDVVGLSARSEAPWPMQHLFRAAFGGDRTDPRGFTVQGLQVEETWMVWRAAPVPLVAYVAVTSVIDRNLDAAHLIARGAAWPAACRYRGNGPWRLEGLDY